MTTSSTPASQHAVVGSNTPWDRNTIQITVQIVCSTHGTLESFRLASLPGSACATYSMWQNLRRSLEQWPSSTHIRVIETAETYEQGHGSFGLWPILLWHSCPQLYFNWQWSFVHVQEHYLPGTVSQLIDNSVTTTETPLCRCLALFSDSHYLSTYSGNVATRW